MSFCTNRRQWNQRMGYRTIVMLGLLGLLLLTGGCGREDTKESSMERCVVRIQAGSLQGSGIVYQKDREQFVIVTAAHVLEQEQNRVQVTFYDDFMVESSSCYVSENSDVAFVLVPTDEMSAGQRKKFTAASVDKEVFDQLTGGSTVLFQSAVEEMEATQQGSVLENWIYVEDFQQYMMLLQGEIHPGMSGGGVFDQNENFLGILCGANEEGEIAAIPLSIIQAEYAGAY